MALITDRTHADCERARYLIDKVHAGETLTAETTHAERDELQLAPGGRFYKSPRSIRVFADDAPNATNVELAE